RAVDPRGDRQRARPDARAGAPARGPGALPLGRPPRPHLRRSRLRSSKAWAPPSLDRAGQMRLALGERSGVSSRLDAIKRSKEEQHMGKRRMRWLLLGVSVAAVAVAAALAASAYGGSKSSGIIIDGTTGTVVNIDP